MKASTKRVLSLLVAGGLVIAAFVVYASFIRPEYDAIQQLRAQRVSLIESYNRQAEATTKVQQLTITQQDKKQQQQRIDWALPPREGVADVVEQLQAIAQASSVSIQSVGLEYLPVKQNINLIKGIGTLRLNLKLFSSYEAFKTFIAALETNIRIMDVATLRTEHAGRPEQNLFIHTLTVDTYYQPTK